MALVIVLVISHILFIAGCYLFPSGITVVVKGLAHAKEIIHKSALLGPIHDPGWTMHDFLTVGVTGLETGIILTRDALRG